MLRRRTLDASARAFGAQALRAACGAAFLSAWPRNQPLRSASGSCIGAVLEISILALACGFYLGSMVASFRCGEELWESQGASAGRENKKPRRPRPVSAIY